MFGFTLTFFVPPYCIVLSHRPLIDNIIYISPFLKIFYIDYSIDL